MNEIIDDIPIKILDKSINIYGNYYPILKYIKIMYGHNVCVYSC